MTTTNMTDTITALAESLQNKCVVLISERDTLRAQLAAIAATEPESIATDQTDEFGEVIYREVYTRPMPAQDVTGLVDCRIELVVAIHSLASNFENILGKIAKDQEAFDKARGDIAHAMKIAERWNWNGTELSKCKGAK